MAKRIGACADDERLHYLLHQLRELEKPTWRYRDQLWGPFACVAPPNRGGLNSTHIHGTSVPVEEPSTASQPDSCTAANGHRHSITSSARSRIAVGNTIPSLFAVLRLMTSSNFVGNSAGTSPGFEPRNTFATIVAP